MSATPNNLPTDRTSLFGRDDDRSRVAHLLREARISLVTLTGMGGIGKTRLAVAVARDMLGDFPEGVWLVDLSSIRDPALVAPTIAGVIGLGPLSDDPLEEAIVEQLKDRRMLLVLDNFEQVLGAAGYVGQLLADCPRLSVLATSRTALGLVGEHQWSVRPLSVPRLSQIGSRSVHDLVPAIRRYPAVRLFVDRAQAANPAFELRADNVQATVELCRRLDGLPLALELAAGRSRVLTPKMMVERALDRSLLSSTAVDRPERQQTLLATITWSYALLSDDERTLFRRLGVFVGGFTAEAAEAVAGSEDSLSELSEPVFDVLEGLVGKSLVQGLDSEGVSPRFGLLEILREYAIEKLEEAGEAGAAKEAHARWLVKTVEGIAPQLSGPEQVAAKASLNAELGNLRAVVEWSLDQGNDAEIGFRLVSACEHSGNASSTARSTPGGWRRLSLRERSS